MRAGLEFWSALVAITWAAEFVIAWLTGRQATKQCGGTTARLLLVAAEIATVCALVPLVAAGIAWSLGRFPLVEIGAILPVTMVLAPMALRLPRHAGDRNRPLPPCQEPAVLATVARTATAMGIATPRVLQSNSPSASLTVAAFACALQSPAILVTDGIVHRLTADERDAMLAHETAHIARGTLRAFAWMTGAAAAIGLGVAVASNVICGIAAMLAAMTLMRTFVSRHDEVACDLLAGSVAGYRSMSLALDKTHTIGLPESGSWAIRLIHTISTHPHPAIRHERLRAAAPDAERATMEDCSHVARRQTVFARWGIGVHTTLFFVAVALARPFPSTAVALFCVVAMARLALLLIAGRSLTKETRRLFSAPNPAGRIEALLGFGGVIVTALTIVNGPSLDGFALSLIGLICLLVGFVGGAVSRPIVRCRQRLLASFTASDFEGVVREAQHRKKRVCRDPGVRYTVAASRAVLGETGPAITEMAALREEFPKFHAPVVIEGILRLDTDPAMALEITAPLQARFPNSPVVALLRARAHRNLGQPAEALAILRRVRPLHPRFGALTAFESCLASDSGDRPRARDLLEDAERTIPGDVWVALARARFAVAFESHAAAAEACTSARDSVAKHPVALLAPELRRIEAQFGNRIDGAASEAVSPPGRVPA